jgi:cytochrome c-type biogenesis protein CcmH
MRLAALLLALLSAAAAAAQPSTAPVPAPSPSAAPAAAAAEAITADARNVLGAPAGPAITGSVLDARTEDVAALLRCPVCQGLSVADSPSSAAQNMKRQIRDLLAAGYDGPQVMAYFERSYGEFVRLQPPLRGINWLLWLAPAVALAGGGFWLVRGSRRRQAARAAEPVAPAEAAAPVDPALAPYRERVRALAYGDDPAVPSRPEKS